MGRLAEADTLFRRLLAHVSHVAWWRMAINAKFALYYSRLLHAEGKYAEEQEILKGALSALRNVEPSPWVLSSILVALARSLQRDDELKEAETLLQEAADIHEQRRLLAGEGFERARFHGASPYQWLASVRLAQGRWIDAWSATEKDYGRVLLELMEDNGSEGSREPSLARVQACLDFRTAIIGWVELAEAGGTLEAWGYVIRNGGKPRWKRLDQHQASPDDRSGLPDRRYVEAISSPPGLFATDMRRAGQGLAASRIGPLLPELSGVRNLIVIPSGSILGVPVEALPLGDSGDSLLAERLTVSYSPSATVYALLHERSRGKVAAASRPLLLVGNPALATDQASAPDTTQHGAQDVASTADVLSRLPRDRVRSVLRGGHRATAELLPLPGTRLEVEGISRLCSASDVYLGRDASEHNLHRLAENGELRRYGVIHLAAHALVDCERPDLSGIVLSQVDVPQPDPGGGEMTEQMSREDGLLRLGEILHDWSIDADLVTLSACETALGYRNVGGAYLGGNHVDRQAGSEGFLGLPHAFFAVGARSLLVSLWKVDDRATSLLMLRFYENLRGEYSGDRGLGEGRPFSKAGALREAKLWLRQLETSPGMRSYAHPYYWAGFVLIGDRGD